MQDRGAKAKGPARPDRARPHAARARLQALADQLGNDAMAQQIARGRATQTDVMTFVTARLQRVAEIQQRECALIRKDGAHWKAWRAMGDGFLPRTKEGDPTRWHVVARAYEAALTAASRGDLHRAKQLVAEARIVEDRRIRDTTDLVRTDDLETGTPDPAWLADAILLSATQPCDIPLETQALIQQICDVTAQMPEMRGKPKIGRRPWWADEEEDDEENEEDG